VDCARAEELFSDRLEGVLEEPLASDLVRHLETCAPCTALFAALQEVRDHLVATPALEPPGTLSERAAVRAREAPLPRSRVALPYWAVAAAAGFCALGTLGASYAAEALPAPRKTAERLVEKGNQTGAWVLERRDRLMEDLRVVRVVVTTAFEGRLDRMTDRVDDYRKAIEKQQEAARPKNKGARLLPHVENRSELERG
jgi:hypothetical protein